MRLLTLALTSLIAPSATAQTLLYTLPSAGSGGVSSVGDVDADGVPDVGMASVGTARVFSGVDGTLLRQWTDGALASFGASLAGAGDVDGDGHGDVLVGAPWDDAGWVTMVSGRDGATLWTRAGSVPQGAYAYALDGAGDVDGDALPDVVVGSGYAEMAHVLRGSDGAVIHQLTSPDPTVLRFGFSVAGVGDLDGDRRDDVAIGQPDGEAAWFEGRVTVYSGATGEILLRVRGDGFFDHFGWSIDGAGDVDADGTPDLVVGAPDEGVWNHLNGGAARIFSGATGETLHTWYGPNNEHHGSGVAGVGDQDCDGYDDVAFTSKSGTHVRSGADGELLIRLAPAPGIWSVAALGDLNGDGREDLGMANSLGRGDAYVYAAPGPLGTSYCGPATSNSSGASAWIELCGSGVAGDALTLRAADLPLREFGYFLASRDQDFVPHPGGSQGNLCLGGTIGRVVGALQSSGDSGTFVFELDTLAVPQGKTTAAVQAGESWSFQAWFRDQNPGPTSNFTDGVELVFVQG